MSEFIVYLLLGGVPLLFLVLRAKFSVTFWRMNKIQKKSGWTFLAVSAVEPILTPMIVVAGCCLISAATIFDQSGTLATFLAISGVLGLFSWLIGVLFFVIFGAVKHKKPLLFVTGTLRTLSVYTAPIFALITLIMFFGSESEEQFLVFFVTSIIAVCIALISLPLHFIYLWHQAHKAKKWMAKVEQKKLNHALIVTE